VPLTRRGRWILAACIVAYVVLSGALSLACLLFMNRRADITSAAVEIPVGGSIAIRGHISSVPNSELVPTIDASSNSTWPPFNALFRWDVAADSTSINYFEYYIYQVGRAHIRNGRLTGTRAGVVIAELRVLGRRSFRAFLIKPVGVTLSLEREALHLNAGDSERLVVSGTSASGVIPGGYVPLGVVHDCTGGKSGYDVGQNTLVERADGRWVFRVDAIGSGSCTLRFQLADDTVAIPFTVTGERDMQHVLHPDKKP